MTWATLDGGDDGLVDLLSDRRLSGGFNLLGLGGEEDCAGGSGGGGGVRGGWIVSAGPVDGEIMAARGEFAADDAEGHGHAVNLGGERFGDNREFHKGAVMAVRSGGELLAGPPLCDQRVAKL